MVYVAQLIGGFFVGYLLASYMESYLHERISDAPAQSVRWWLRYPRIFRLFLKTRFSHHVVHHYMTYRASYVTQFASEDDRLRLDKALRARGRHGIIIIGGNYANHLHAEGALIFCLPMIVVAVLASLIVPVCVAIGMLPALSLPPLFSYVLHPYLHMPIVSAQRAAPKPIAMLLRTRYARVMWRNHFLHHEYKGTSNFNLVLGADVVRGRSRRASPEDLEKMRNLGIA